MGPDLEINNLHFGYNGNNLFSRLSFASRPGEPTVILGESGSGKTTLLKLAAGIITPTSGQVKIKGIDIHQSSPRELTTLYHQIGFLFQDTALIANMNILDNIILPLEYHTLLSRNEIHERARRYLHRFELENFTDSLPAQISIGLKKRAALARALIVNPKILFLDDPLAEADQHFREIIIGLIEELKETISIISTTSNLDDAAFLGDHILLIHRGEIIRQGSLSEIESAAYKVLGESEGGNP